MARARANAPLVWVWHWQLATLRDAPKVRYLGVRERRARVHRLLCLGEPCAASTSETIWASQAPLPGALKVPQLVHMVVPLERSLDETLRGMDANVRRPLRERSRYVRRQVTEPAELRELSEQMVTPFAIARHGDEAVLMPYEVLERIALGSGRLDLVTRDGAPVACHLGYPHTLPNARAFVAVCFGYPRAVFEDARALAEINALNVFLAMEDTIARGFDFYDMGSCRSQPDDGLFQWKRRRAGAPDVSHATEWVHVKLPRHGAAELLWHAPLLTAGADALALQLGLPRNRDDDQAMQRWRHLRIDGLRRVVVHAERALGLRLKTWLTSLFAGLRQQPELVTHT